MVETNIDSLSHDASPSWHGFNYQGKVAIYLVISRLIEETVLEEPNKYELELEYLEDFSILYKDKYQTIHQVKSLQSSNIGRYKEACLKLIEKLEKIEEVSKAFLHVSTEIKLENNFAEDFLELLNSDDSKENDIINNYEKLTENLDLYSYSSNLYCGFDDLETNIYNYIEKYFKIKNFSYSETRLKRAYHFLLGLIDINIKLKHQEIQNKSNRKIRINFEDFINVLNENYDSISEECAIIFSKNKFSKLRTDFSERMSRDIELGELTEELKGNFIRVTDNIISLGNDEFLNFCRKIKPTFDYQNTSDTLEYINQFIVDSEINTCFFKILRVIERELNTSNFTYKIRDEEQDYRFYLPSAIMEDDKYSVSLKIDRSDNEEVLFEVDKIITHSINVENIGTFNTTYKKSSEKDYNRITKTKKISLIDIDTAKGELS